MMARLCVQMGRAVTSSFEEQPAAFCWKRGEELPPFVASNSQAVSLCVQIIAGTAAVPNIVLSEAVAVQIYRLFFDKSAPPELKRSGTVGMYTVLASLFSGTNATADTAADTAAAKRLHQALTRKGGVRAPGLDVALRWKVGQRAHDPVLKSMDFAQATEYLLKQWDLLPLQFDFPVARAGAARASAAGGGGDPT